MKVSEIALNTILFLKFLPDSFDSNLFLIYVWTEQRGYQLEYNQIGRSDQRDSNDWNKDFSMQTSFQNKLHDELGSIHFQNQDSYLSFCVH